MKTIYDRIRALRMERNMTQEDLAKAMGYKDRSMITKIEGGKVDISQKKIVDFAEILGTTPRYLMDGDPAEEALAQAVGSLTDRQKELMEQEKKKFFDNPDIAALINGFSRMSPDQIRKAKEVLKAVFTDCFDEKPNDNS